MLECDGDRLLRSQTGRVDLLERLKQANYQVMVRRLKDELRDARMNRLN